MPKSNVNETIPTFSPADHWRFQTIDKSPPVNLPWAAVSLHFSVQAQFLERGTASLPPQLVDDACEHRGVGHIQLLSYRRRTAGTVFAAD